MENFSGMKASAQRRKSRATSLKPTGEKLI
jgi:hypothetical protein